MLYILLGDLDSVEQCERNDRDNEAIKEDIRESRKANGRNNE